MVALPRGGRPRRLPSWLRRLTLSLPGSTGALVFACASFTPSLVPRPWYVQGIVGGLSAVFGYGLGVFLAWLVRASSGWTPSPRVVVRLWVVFAGVGIPVLVWSMVLGQRWQREIHMLTNVPPPESTSWIPLVLGGFSVLVVIIWLARAVRWLVRQVTKRLLPRMPGRLARASAVVIVVLALVLVNNGLVWRGLVTVANSVSGAMNNTTNEGTYRPDSPERSGSPSSYISWESLGRQGRDFVGLGPTQADLKGFSGQPAKEPVRVYSGLKSEDSTAERAALAVRELRRAGGFDRAVLLVATTTGTGLVDPAAVDSLEYMYNGDTATVALQYSYLPSFISLLVDDNSEEVAGRELFNQVYDAWAELPSDDRPELLVTGTSIGVVASESAFSGLADIRNRTDGVVWAGAPNFSPLHHLFVQRREPGTPEWLPIYGDGRTVRFISKPADLHRPAGPWPRPRVVYLQNGSDPVVFWSPRLAFSKPDWLYEPRAPDVSPNMRWIPVVTFWQVTADLPSTYYVPPGHGHRYGELYADAWAAVAPPPGWTPEDTRELRVRIREDLLAREPALMGGAG